jgi:hypothetical protein
MSRRSGLLLVLLLTIGCQRPPAARTPDAGMTAPDAGVRHPDAGVTNTDGTARTSPPSPPDEPGHSVVLSYQDFGPQAMAYELLGPEWWSWEPGGNYETSDEFDVRVVVYRGRSLAEVEARYPIVKPISDYRYVKRTAALRYLDDNLLELGDGGDVYDVGSRQRLTATRAAIVRGLGP